MFMEGIRTSVKGRGKRVVFPEGVEERALGAAAIGPILPGLRKPVNDVSRGSSVQDLTDAAAITAALAARS